MRLCLPAAPKAEIGLFGSGRSVIFFRIFDRWNRERGAHTARPVLKDFSHSSKVAFWKSSDIISVSVTVLDRDDFTIITTFKSNRACKEDLYI